jgi:2'-5' RNA ligase
VTTIGVSLAVPEPWGGQLQDYRVTLGDSTGTGIPTHITLLPPIDVDEELLPAIDQHLAAAAAGTEPFLVHLRGSGTFRPVSPVVFVNVAAGISSCEVLARAVRRGPLAVETQYPFHPHVTVAHHLDDAQLDRAYDELSAFECRFVADRYWLYVHADDRGWTPVRAFPFAGAGLGRCTPRGTMTA